MLEDKPQPLPREFYAPSALVVATRLLGHWLLRRTATGYCGGPIVETEAYLRDDPAAHSYRGKTKRNQVMWGEPGHAYVYFIYGNHYCVNAVCQPEGLAEAVLIRAIEPCFGLELMQGRRKVRRPADLTNGPGKLCAAMEINRDFDGVDLCREGELFIGFNSRQSSYLSQNGPMVETTRIGITQASEKPWRFYLEKNPYVSHKETRRVSS